VSHPLKHRAQADQGLVPEPKVSPHRRRAFLPVRNRARAYLKTIPDR
jgi:hypothetical protein